jgi:GMP synthase (glutamine-hydrolysing)
VTRKVAVFQHVAFEDLGSFEQVLQERGFHIDTFQLGVDDLGRAYAEDPDLLVVLGGPISVNDAARFPFLAQEQAIIRARLLCDAPCLGIGLGAQLMALALGAAVAPMRDREIGWSPVRLNELVASNDPLQILGQETALLHWHDEQLAIPAGAVSLASTPACPHQAFAWKRNGLALQFHPEVSARGLERWYIGHVAALNAAGCDIVALRNESRRKAEPLRVRAQAFLREWLAPRGL